VGYRYCSRAAIYLSLVNGDLLLAVVKIQLRSIYFLRRNFTELLRQNAFAWQA
jgi:hypothetical protein